MCFMKDMLILHHLKLYFFSTFSLLAPYTQTIWFTPHLQTEDMLSEVLRCEGLHKWKYGVVDAGEKQQIDPVHQGSQQIPMYHNTRLDDTKEHHLHQP